MGGWQAYFSESPEVQIAKLAGASALRSIPANPEDTLRCSVMPSCPQNRTCCEAIPNLATGMSNLEGENDYNKCFNIRPWFHVGEPNLLSVGRTHWALHPTISEEFEFDWENCDELGRANFKFSKFFFTLPCAALVMLLIPQLCMFPCGLSC